MKTMTTTTTQEIGICPACKKPFVATVAVEADGLSLDSEPATVNVTVKGLRLQHDCIPKTPRG